MNKVSKLYKKCQNELNEKCPSEGKGKCQNKLKEVSK